MKKKTKSTEPEINMEELINNIDDEKASDFYEKSSKEAEEILKDEDKAERFLQKLEKKLKTVPVAGSVLIYVPIMISLVRNYIKKEYTDPPVTTIASIIVTLIYFLSPIDLIPDTIPGVGYLDDAAVIAGCLALIKTDIEDYRLWRKNNGLELDDIPDYDEISEEAEKYKEFAEVFFSGKRSATKKK